VVYSQPHAWKSSIFLKEFIDNFIVSRCIASVRPLSLTPTAYPFLFYHSSLVLVTSVVLANILYKPSLYAAFSYLHLPRTTFSGEDRLSSLQFHIFLCCYLIVACCRLGGINIRSTPRCFMFKIVVSSCSRDVQV